MTNPHSGSRVLTPSNNSQPPARTAALLTRMQVVRPRETPAAWDVGDYHDTYCAVLASSSQQTLKHPDSSAVCDPGPNVVLHLTHSKLRRTQRDGDRETRVFPNLRLP